MTSNRRPGAFAACLACAGGIALLAFGPSGNDFRFAILGDRTGIANQKVFEQIWLEIANERPDFVINVGDMIEGGNDNTAEAEWLALRRTWDRFKIPLFLTPGNHDIWSETSRSVFEKQAGHAPPYSFNFQDAHFTVLDNSGSLNLSAGQMQFLERDLLENRNRRPKFVFFHQPFWLIPLKFQSGEFPLHQLARKYGVDYVISGHDHQYVRLARDGIVYLEAGSSGGKLKGDGFEQGWFYQHALVRVKGTRAGITIKEIGPPFGKGRVLNATTN